MSKVVIQRKDEELPLLFLPQTSKIAFTSDCVKSGVSHLPWSISMTTASVSKTSESVSSEVSSRNGPKSLAIRGAKGMRAESSPP